MNVINNRLAIVIGFALSAATFSIGAFSAEPMLSTGGYATEYQKMGLMKMLDADGNHMVSLTEFNQFNSSVFDELDTNHDGVLNANEWVGKTIGKKELSVATGGYSHALRDMKMMELMDSDGDHTVTKEEFLAHEKKIFVAKDQSGDEEISQQEWAAKGLTGH